MEPRQGKEFAELSATSEFHAAPSRILASEYGQSCNKAWPVLKGYSHIFGTSFSPNLALGYTTVMVFQRKLKKELLWFEIQLLKNLPLYTSWHFNLHF